MALKIFMKKIISNTIFGIFGLGLFFANANSVFAAAPVVNTNSATNITDTSATLNGYFNGNGLPTDTAFQYGTVASGGSIKISPRASQVSSFGEYSYTITGLLPNTTYYFRGVAQNASGITIASNIIKFKTLAPTPLPVVSTNSASLVTTTSATLNGYFNGNGTATSTYFEYGTLSNSLILRTSSVSQSSPFGSFSDSIGSLAPNTTYYFRAVAVNSAGVVKASNILSFLTTQTIPNPVCSIDSFSASDTDVSRGASVTLSWSTTNCTTTSISGVGIVTPASSGSYTIVVNADTTFTLTASNPFGTVTRDVFVNTRSSSSGGGGSSSGGTTAQAYTYQPTNITSNGAIVSGYVQTNGQSVTAWIEFTCGSGIRYESYSSSGTINLSHSFSGLLMSNTTYCYRVGYTTNSGYSFYGNSVSFTTLPAGSSYSNGGGGTTTRTTTVIKPTGETVSTDPWGEFPSSFDSNNNFLGASAFGAGSFLPDTFIGWLLLVIFVMAIVLIARALMTPKHQ